MTLDNLRKLLQLLLEEMFPRKIRELLRKPHGLLNKPLLVMPLKVMPLQPREVAKEERKEEEVEKVRVKDQPMNKEPP
jgi:hypothetical protein